MKYRREAVERILKARSGKKIRLPDNPQKFLQWLECEKNGACLTSSRLDDWCEPCRKANGV